MVISETTLLNRESARKQVTMPAYAVSALKSGEIKQMTKGIVAYECLMLANEEYEDSLQQIRARVTDELEGALGGLLVRDALKKIIRSRAPVAVEDLQLECEYDYPDRELSHVNLHLPTTLIEQLPMERYVGEHVKDAVVFTVASPWESRVELVTDLLDLLALTRSEEPEEPSEFVVEVMTGRSNRYAAEVLEPLHEAVMGDSPYQPLDRDGKRTDVDGSVDGAVDGSVDGVPAWASAYSWEDVGLSPESELEVQEAMEVASSAGQTPKQRVPVVYGRMNSVGVYAQEDGDDESPYVGAPSVWNWTNNLFRHNDALNTPEEATLSRYADETIELMRESPDWFESPIRKAYEEGVTVPSKLVDSESVKGDEGFEHVEHGVKDDFDVFSYQDSSIIEEHREVVVTLIEDYEQMIEETELPSLDDVESMSLTEKLKAGNSTVRSNARKNIEQGEEQIEQGEALLAWIDEQFE
jgi:hypothetical protein